jgi:hypothetical protein
MQQATRSARPSARRPGAHAVRRAVWAAAIAVVAVVLFLVYLRQSDRVPVGSDGASNALQAWDMLHGNPLLRDWTVSDVSFWPAELVQYAMIEAVRGLTPAVVHIAGAMTYALLILLAAWLAKGRATGREALLRAAIVAIVMLAPAPGAASTVLLSPNHFGSALPVLLAWLAVDRLPARWSVPAVAVVLTWGVTADSLVLVTGVVPMVIACAARAGVLLFRRSPGAERSWPWAELSLAVAAIASVGLARAVVALIRHAGGFGIQPVATTFSGLSAIPHHLALTGEGLLMLFGAEFPGVHSPLDLAIAALHLIGVAAAAVALCLAVARLGRGDELAVPGLALAIICNLVAYVPTPFVQDLLSARDISAVLPFAAVLAGRLLAGPLLARPALRVRLTAAVAVVAAACAAALGYNAAQPAVPAQNQSLVAWLAARHLNGGLAVDYWVANSTSLDSGNRITIRQVGQQMTLGGGVLTEPVPRELNSAWYRPASHYADFYVARDINPGSSAEQAAAVRTFGPPAQTLHPAGYTVLVWHKNLLAGLR